MASLNSVIEKLIKPIAEDHLQINDFGVGDLPTLAKNKGAVKYPLLWLVLNNVSYGGKEFNYNLSLIFADIAKEDLSNCLEIQSDMIQVAADFAAVLSNVEDDLIQIENDFTLKPFSERFADQTSGVVMDLVIKVTKALNDCEAPLKSKL